LAGLLTGRSFDTHSTHTDSKVLKMADSLNFVHFNSNCLPIGIATTRSPGHVDDSVGLKCNATGLVLVHGKIEFLLKLFKFYWSKFEVRP
jgi:hypothetical protein